MTEGQLKAGVRDGVREKEREREEEKKKNAWRCGSEMYGFVLG